MKLDIGSEKNASLDQRCLERVKNMSAAAGGGT